MPIARASQSRVREQADPIVTANQRPDIESFGGGQGVTGIARVAVGEARELQKFADAQTFEADKLMVTDFDNQLTQMSLTLEKEAKAKKGINAFKAVEEADAAFTSFASGLQAQANTDVQRAALDELINRRKTQLNQSVDNHTVRQIEVENQRAYEARDLLFLESAADHSDDPIRLAGDWGDYKETQEDEMKRQGLGKDARSAFMLAKSSQFHSVVLDNLIDAGLTQDAVNYLEFATTDTPGLTDAALDRVNAALEVSLIDDSSQAIVDNLMATEDNYTDRFKELKKIDDVKLRQEAERVLDRTRSREKSLKAERISENYMEGLNAMEANPQADPRDVIPTTVWSQFSKAQRDSLIRMSPEGQKTMNMEKYKEFYLLSANDKAKMTLGEVNEKYLSYFTDPAYRKTALNAYLRDSKSVSEGSNIKGKLQPIEYANQFLIDEEFMTIDKKFDVAGFDKFDDEKYRVFVNEFNRAVIQFQESPDNSGGLPNEAQSKDIANNILYQTLKVSDDRAKKAVEFIELSAEEIKKSGIPFQKIEDGNVTKGLTANDVLRLENLLRSKNIPKPEGFGAVDESVFGDSRRDVDALYSTLVQQYAKAISSGDSFKASQLIIKYKKELKDR